MERRSPGILQNRGVLGAVGPRQNMKFLVRVDQGLGVQCHGSGSDLCLLTLHAVAVYFQGTAVIHKEGEIIICLDKYCKQGGPTCVFGCVGKEEPAGCILHTCDALRGAGKK